MKNSIQIEQTPEGLKIDLVDDPKKPMFSSGGAVLTEDGKKVLDSMANIISKTPNQITIIGNTDAEGPSANSRYTIWELSADRANAARRALVTTQLGSERVAKVVGLADRQLLVKEEPTNPRNRRVTVILMRGSYARDPNKVQPSGRAILSVGDAQIKPPEPPPEPVAAPAEPAKPSIFDTPPVADKPEKP
jgi:chemotaxis protein MotB